jgi:hypothetical protein
MSSSLSRCTGWHREGFTVAPVVQGIDAESLVKGLGRVKHLGATKVIADAGIYGAGMVWLFFQRLNLDLHIEVGHANRLSWTT